MVLNLALNKLNCFVSAAVVAICALGIAIWKKPEIISLQKANKQSNMLPELKQPWVHMADPDRVEKLLNKMVQDGGKHLQVIADFDRTLTSFKVNGEMVDTCHQALDNGSVLPPFYRGRATTLRDHYYAIEIDPSLTNEEKIPHMIEWWTRAHDLLVDTKLDKAAIKTIVADSTIKLRSGCMNIFDDLHQHKIPLLIFSAGVGDIIIEALKQRGKYLDNMKVVSNFMEFDAEDKLVGFQGEMIHIFNKNEAAIHKSDYFNSIKHCHNVVLMGDSVGDLHMADGAYHMQDIIRIGFLNDKVDALLEKYKSLYDIVLVNDETMDVPNAIFNKIL